MVQEIASDTGESRIERVPIAGATEPVVVRHVAYGYGAERTLADASLTVAPGKAVVVTGENGAGKSTLLRLILGELKPQVGEVRLFGRDPARFRDWSRVGYVPQRTVASYGQFPASVLEVVCGNLYRSAPRFLPLSRKLRDRARAALAAVRADDLAQRMIGELSGGQFQRVLLARALVAEPDLLVLDEPTSGLDAAAAQDFCALLSRLRQERPQIAVLMVTHDLERLSALDAQVYRLADGMLARVDR